MRDIQNVLVATSYFGTHYKDRTSDILKHIEDLSRVVISYEIYETSLRRVSYTSYEMTMSERFCLSYDLFKLYIIAFRMDNISRKKVVDTDVVNDVTCSRQSVITRVVIRFL